jgi:hypothetical protein
MTHQAQLEQLLAEFDIAYQTREAASQAYTSEEGAIGIAEWDVSLDIGEGQGLPGFVASFYFDENGGFLAHRVWKRE